MARILRHHARSGEGNPYGKEPYDGTRGPPVSAEMRYGFRNKDCGDGGDGNSARESGLIENMSGVSTDVDSGFVKKQCLFWVKDIKKIKRMRRFHFVRSCNT